MATTTARRSRKIDGSRLNGRLGRVRDAAAPSRAPAAPRSANRRRRCAVCRSFSLWPPLRPHSPRRRRRPASWRRRSLVGGGPAGPAALGLRGSRSVGGGEREPRGPHSPDHGPAASRRRPIQAAPTPASGRHARRALPQTPRATSPATATGRQLASAPAPLLARRRTDLRSRPVRRLSLRRRRLRRRQRPNRLLGLSQGLRPRRRLPRLRSFRSVRRPIGRRKGRLSACAALPACRPRQRDQRLDHGVVLVAAARQWPRRSRIEAAVADQRVVDVKSDDLA